MLTRRALGRLLAAGSGLALVAAAPTARLPRGARSRRLPALVVNQAGYLPELPKRALLIGAGIPAETVDLIEDASGRSIARLAAGQLERDPLTGDLVQAIDFGHVDRPGRYWLRAGPVQSHSFAIDPLAFDLAFATMLRSYWLQRCGVAVDDPVSGVRHPPCHTADGALAHSDGHGRAGSRIDAVGGWHDAGDFGKYVATATVTIGRLLSLYERHPGLFADGQLAIPESGNRRPDLLDEMAVGLDWLLKMQRRDGAVYRKLSGREWPGPVPPHADRQERFVFGVSSPETAKFAAVTAMAARLYPPAEAEPCLAAARRAWAWLEAVPEQQVEWVEGDDGGSGKYLFSEIDDEATLTYDWDDRLWAAAELWVTTGEERFARALAKLAARAPYTLFEWKDPSALGLADYLFAARPEAAQLRPRIRERLLDRAGALVRRAATNGYGIVIERFKWGSNKMIAEEGVTLADAWRLTGRRDYLEAAVGQLDYLLGRNPFDMSFVTGIGAAPVRDIHHRIAEATGTYIPGFLVGGAFPDAPDGVAPRGLGPLSYVDNRRSYATNENAIDYNAAIIALMGALMAPQRS